MDRLGNLLKSYLSYDKDGAYRGFHGSGDPDLDDAYEELNDFLGGGGASAKAQKAPDWEDPYRSTAGGGQSFWSETESRKVPPETLRGDFAELGVAFGADEETCKTVRKKLLKEYHPDRHGGDEVAVKKAAAKSAKINAAYDNIRKWRASIRNAD
jgi:curved DNA-binding protein CbpA